MKFSLEPFPVWVHAAGSQFGKRALALNADLLLKTSQRVVATL
jgi:hypothetical protein